MGAPGRAGSDGGTAAETDEVGSAAVSTSGRSGVAPPPTTRLELAKPTGPVLSRAVRVGGPTQDQEWQEAINRLPATSALLRVERGVRGARFLLNTDRTTVGRHLGSDIFLDHATVSRTHAVFERQGTEFRVRDHGSLNGTYVNGERVETASLQTGDRIQIGKFGMAFYQPLAEGMPEPSAMPRQPPTGTAGPHGSHPGTTQAEAAPGAAADRPVRGWWSGSRVRLRAWFTARRRGG